MQYDVLEYDLSMETDNIHLLTFEPIYKERIWGGRNLERLFGRALPENVLIGESWELADLPEDKSVINVGPAKGKNIAELVRQWGISLLGDAKLDGGQFPLLIKLLDANDILSVQVHPDYQSAKEFGGNVRAKYEAWYVVDAQPDAFIYRGFKEGVTLEDVQSALEDNRLAEIMIKLPAKKGDFFYLPGGTVHALGKGLVVAEVQTPSDTTFRLYDWGRIDKKTGKPRELHIEQALKSIRFYSQQDFMQSTGLNVLVDAPTFRISKYQGQPEDRLEIKSGQACVWIIIAGNGLIEDKTVSVSLEAGKTILIPAALEDVRATFQTHYEYLEVTLTGQK